jgi:glycosyltransferase involved in cell wall biosynthesis
VGTKVTGLTHQTSSPTGCDDCIIVVPCFNEAKRLDEQAFTSFLAGTPGVTLLFVDDGSVDATPVILERLRQQRPERISTLRLSANAGKGEAVRQGLISAMRRRPSMAGYWDADLATPLSAIPRFSELLKSRPELSLVIGSRVALMGRHIRRSQLRHFMGRVFATAASLIVELPVYDTQCGAKLFRVTPATSALFEQPFRSRWFFDVEILARMVANCRLHGGANAHTQIYEFPLDEWHDVPGSRLRPLDYLRAGIDLASIGWRYRLRRVPSHVGPPAACTQLEAGIPASDKQ